MLTEKTEQLGNDNNWWIILTKTQSVMVHRNTHTTQKDSTQNLVLDQHIQWQITRQWLVVTEVRSESFRLVTQHHHYNACAIYACGCYVRPVVFSLSSVVSRTFSVHAHAMCVFDVRASSSPHRYPCAKFRFCRSPQYWASLERKIAYSLNHSLSHLIT